MDSYRKSTLLPSMLLYSSLVSQDLLIEILKRLPAKTLCKFLSVCKQWKTLISSTLFVQLHTSAAAAVAASTPPNLKPYFQPHRYNSYSIRYRQQPPLVRRLDYPFLTNHHATDDGFTLLGVIHGVVCLSYTSDSRFDSNLLWNPAIHRYVTLPYLPFPVDLEKAEDEFVTDHENVNIADYVEYVDNDAIYIDDYAFFNRLESHADVDGFYYEAKMESNVIGFGYDSSNNDFKVVRIWIPNQDIESHCSSVLPTYEVYSNRAGIWRVETADNLKSCGFYGDEAASKIGCYVNGRINWIISAANDKRSVLMFDCSTDEFSFVDIPVCVSFPERTELTEYAGLLSLMVEESSSEYTFWVMEEHGVASSWTKLYKFKNGATGLELRNLYEDMYMELSPLGVEQLAEMGQSYSRYNQTLSGHLYEETLYLMDDVNAKSYVEDEGVEAV